MIENNELYIQATNHRDIENVDINKIQRDLSCKDFSLFNLHSFNNLPPTPFSKECSFEIDKIGLPLLTLHCKLNIFPIVYEGENDGRLIRHVAPMQKSQSHISSQGSVYDFDMHVDNPDLSILGDKNFIIPSPETLSLFCARNPQNIPTNIVRLDDILNLLNYNDISLLSDNVFEVKRPDSFEEQNVKVKNLPVLNFYQGKYYSRFDSHNIFTSSKEHQYALDKFRNIANNNTFTSQLVLRQGQCIIFNNQRVLHARKSFKPNFDGNDRWLIRIFGLYNKPNILLLKSIKDNHHIRVM